ncbi:MAG: hypothetical protein JXM70_28260 [Pirellulales bacterium]|nr:hypothetical protein [Pirellulales bacterium]
MKLTSTIPALILLTSLLFGSFSTEAFANKKNKPASKPASTEKSKKVAPKKQVVKKKKPPENALDWIPADIAFYRAALRNREQVEIVLNSRAWAKLCEMPICREYARLLSHPMTQATLRIGKSKLAEAQPATGQVETILNDPQVQRLIEFLIDICSDEVFVYGDRGFVNLVDMLQEINLASLNSMLEGKPNADVAVLRAIAQNADHLAVPNLVMGLRIRDRHLAAEQLGKLELMLGMACWTQPELNGRMRREQIDGANYLTFNLDSRLFFKPKTDLRIEGLDKQKAALLRKKIEDLKLTIALGIKGDYLLLSLGPSTDGLAMLNMPGKKKQSKRLIDRVEMRPVRDMKGCRLTSICYRSREFNRALYASNRYAAAIARRLDAGIASANFDKDTKIRLQTEAAALRKDIESLRRKPGALVKVCLMSERGMESYCFDRSQHPWLKGYKPLGLLEHVGGRPLLMKSFRATFTVAQYDMATKWLARSYDLFEDRVLWNIDPAWRKSCRLTVALLRPILRQIDRVNRQVLIPTLQDGQIMFLINEDGPAFVTDTTAAERLQEVFTEYWTVYSDVVDALEDTRRGQRPDFNAAKPTISPCPLPEWMRLYENSAVGRTGRVVIVATSPTAVKRLLEPAPPTLGGLSTKPKHHRATVCFIDTAALASRVEPGVKQTVGRLAQQAYNGQNSAEVQKQIDLHVDTLFECVRVLHSVACERYVEKGAVVTHKMWELRDVD